MDHTRKTVLLVEDSPIVQEMTRMMLEEAGFEVRTATGNAELEDKVASQPEFLEGIDLMVLDMELSEEHGRQREDKDGIHRGVSMTGSQIGAFLPMAQPSLAGVPFLIYSGKERDEIDAHLAEIEEFASTDERIRSTYKGFVSKQSGTEGKLIEAVRQVFAG